MKFLFGWGSAALGNCVGAASAPSFGMPADELLVISNGTVILPSSMIPDGMVVCREGIIVEVGPGDQLTRASGVRHVDANGGYITPGFIDIHVHGGAGADYMDGTIAAVTTANCAHARHGTTTIFPTTTTGSPSQIALMIEACRRAQASWKRSDGARISGVHLYGPYFAENKVGCHKRSGRRDPEAQEYLQYLDGKMIRIATCAAELPGAEAFYRAAAERGCLVTCGHSNASWTEMSRAFAAGMRHVDHFWCAMSSVPSMRARFGTPTQGSMEQFVLMHDEMSTEVIADGCHLAPELLEFAYRMKAPERLCLVTDSNRALDMPPGQYQFGPDADGGLIESDGHVGRQQNGGLASSVVGMDTMVRTMFRNTSAGIVNAIRMASLTPAERAGIAHETGSLQKGKKADLLILNRELCVERVFIGGQEFQPDS